MKDKSGIFSLTLTAFLCVCLIIAGTIYVSSDSDVLNNNVSIKEYIISTPDEQAESEKDVPSSVNVSAKADAVGKVIPQFISPYNSKTSYNRVYIKNRAGIQLDIAKYLNSSNPVKIEKNSQPQVLIMHTHTTECYLTEDRDYYTDADLTRTRDTSYNVTAIGKIIADMLGNAGIVTLHDKTEHDYPAYNGSYNRSGETVKKYLSQYPSIKIVIDLHRDSIAGNGTDRVKPVVEIDGKNAAQVMLVMGCGETVANHENWGKNFTFAVKYQQTMEVLYPGLARQLALVSSRYNQHLTTGSILLEVGTESNSFEEAAYGARLAGTALISYLNTLT